MNESKKELSSKGFLNPVTPLHCLAIALNVSNNLSTRKPAYSENRDLGNQYTVRFYRIYTLNMLLDYIDFLFL